jgi:phosphatidylglycerol:prolipoprotein diacylglycerol transferase
MHPILFRIPLPNKPLFLWWALAAFAALSAIYAIWSFRKADKNSAASGLVIAVALGAAGYVFRDKNWQLENLPIYSYGVMLGISLIVGWYLTLKLATLDGLPKETMANCYVITAVVAVIGSRLLFIATNPDDFKEVSDVFALRRGGLVAYGGFLGGYLGSWLYLSRNRVRLMPWADVAVPSLASGLFITRIGCYLYGCDFGTRLDDGAPAWLKALGTFPHTKSDAGEGSPAWLRHVDLFKGTPAGIELTKLDHSFPVHPTQIYESVAGLLLVVLLLTQRKNQKFRGQIFFLFTFLYGVIRFIIEIFRDDTERGSFGPFGTRHVMVSFALLLMALGFTFGIALGIKNEKTRTIARVLSFVFPVAAFVVLRPQSFAESTRIQFSTSQWVALLSGLAVSYFYARFWLAAQKNPQMAMGLSSLGDGVADLAEKEAEEEEKAKKPKKSESKKSDDDVSSEARVKAKKAKKADDHDDDTGDPADDHDAESDDKDSGSVTAAKSSESRKSDKSEDDKPKKTADKKSESAKADEEDAV